jgi:hypothetical protein
MSSASPSRTSAPTAGRPCGDFTGALSFSGGPADYPRYNQAISLATAEAELLTAQEEVFSNPPPQIPAVSEPLPSSRSTMPI